MECYFFGTFNPPHNGHITLAAKVKEEFGFDKIIFVPAFVPPHKSTLDFKHRFNMTKLAVPPELGIVSDVEAHLEPPSYTCKTAEHLFIGTRGAKIPFIIGYDAFIDIEKWKNPEILKEKLFFIVLKRRGGAKKEDILKLKDKGFEFELAKTILYLDISSRNIRDCVFRGLSIENFVDKKVGEYIYENGLYR